MIASTPSRSQRPAAPSPLVEGLGSPCLSCAAPQGGAGPCAACGAEVPSGAMSPGSVVASRYEVRRALGSGGMGIVYEAYDRILDEVVALKVLRRDVTLESESAVRFRSEIKLAWKVRHKNVCGIHEYGEEGDLRYISMERVGGSDLKRVLREKGALPWAEAYDVAVQAAEGLQAIHEAGVIHRDLKTPNITRDASGLVRLMDFGIAKQEGSPGVTSTGQVMGSPEYMSPEQVRGQALDPRSDIYALGVVVFEIFTGQLPFRAESPVATMLKHIEEPPPLEGPEGERIPPALVLVLRRALAKAPADRYATAGEMVEALRDARAASQETPEPAASSSGEPAVFNFRGALRATASGALATPLKPPSSAGAGAPPDSATPATRMVPGLSAPRLTNTPTGSSLAAVAPLPPASVSLLNARGEAPAALEPAALAEGPETSKAATPELHLALPGLSAERAAAGFTFHEERPRPRARLSLTLTLVAAAAVAYTSARGRVRTGAPPARSVPAPSPEATPDSGRIFDLERRLRAIEEARVQAEARALEESQRRQAAEAAMKGRAMDPAMFRRLQQEARHAAEEELGKRLEAERKSQQEAKEAGEARVAEERRKAEESARLALASASPLPPAIPPPAAVRPGTLVELTAPGVIGPLLLRKPPLEYPPIALRSGVQGTIELSVLVDERGDVIDVRWTAGAPSLAQAAVRNARGRKYRPATKDGVPVRVWTPERIRFELR